MDSHIKIVLLGSIRSCRAFLDSGSVSEDNRNQSNVVIREGFRRSTGGCVVVELHALPKVLGSTELLVEELKCASAILLTVDVSSPSSCSDLEALRQRIASACLPYDFPVVLCGVARERTTSSSGKQQKQKPRKYKDACEVKPCDVERYGRHFGYLTEWLEVDSEGNNNIEAKAVIERLVRACVDRFLLYERAVSTRERTAPKTKNLHFLEPLRGRPLLEHEERQLPTWVDVAPETSANKYSASLARTSITTVERVRVGASELLTRRFWKEQGIDIEAGSRHMCPKNEAAGNDTAISNLVHATEVEIANLERSGCEAEIVKDFQVFASLLTTFVCSEQERSRLLQLEELTSCFEELVSEARAWKSRARK